MKYHFPEVLKNMTPTEKLVWVFIRINGENSYSGQMLADELGIFQANASTALTTLKHMGLILEIKPPTRGRGGAGSYKALDKPLSDSTPLS